MAPMVSASPMGSAFPALSSQRVAGLQTLGAGVSPAANGLFPSVLQPGSLPDAAAMSPGNPFSSPVPEIISGRSETPRESLDVMGKIAARPNASDAPAKLDAKFTGAAGAHDDPAAQSPVSESWSVGDGDASRGTQFFRLSKSFLYHSQDYPC